MFAGEEEVTGPGSGVALGSCRTACSVLAGVSRLLEFGAAGELRLRGGSPLTGGEPGVVEGAAQSMMRCKKHIKLLRAFWLAVSSANRCLSANRLRTGKILPIHKILINFAY